MIHRMSICLTALFIVLGLAQPLHGETTQQLIQYSRSGLNFNGTLLNGQYDVRFTLFDAGSGGNQVGPIRTKTGVNISSGNLPAQNLAYSNGVFNGLALWMEVSARQGANAYAPAGARQRLFAVPYAMALPGLYTKSSGDVPNIIGGLRVNTISDDVAGSTIAGGGTPGSENVIEGNQSFIGSGVGNSIMGNNSMIGAGRFNVAFGDNSGVAAGAQNFAQGNFSFVGGGSNNDANGNYSVVAGGAENIASGNRSFIGSGSANSVTALYGFIGGGQTNTVSGGNSVVAGGLTNTASNNASTVGGGSSNVASGIGSTVPGGVGNLAGGDYSFAAGRSGKAGFAGSFVFADSTDADFSATGADLFTVRCSGGVSFYTSSDLSTGVAVSSGSGTWSNLSDRNAKQELSPVDVRHTLQGVLSLPISTWSYIAQDKSIRHIGPMAQDFHAAFGVGEDNRHITTIDADGVLFAAMQGLHQLVEEKNVRIDQLEHSNHELRERIERLEALLLRE